MEERLVNTVSRRTFLGGALAAGGFIIAGCGSSSSSERGSSAPQSKGGGASSAKNLRIGIAGDINLAAALRFTAANQPIRRTVFDYLIDKNADGTYAPLLATAWEWSKDQKTLVITLRDGVTYHNGRPFGPDDVVYTVNQAMTKEAGAQAGQLLKGASGIKKTGKNQVTVTFEKPFPAYLDGLAMLPVVDQKTYADLASGKQVIGTGPFTWQSHTAGSKIEMAKFASYWQDGKPYVEHLKFDIIKDEQALLAAMQSGDLDMANAMVARDAVTLKKSGKFNITQGAGYDVYVGVNTKVKPLDDVRVRQAIAYALDRKRIVSQVYQGLAEPSCVPWSDSTPGVTKSQINHYDFDLDKAKSLVEAAGAAGTTIALTSFPPDPATGAIAQIVQYSLTQIGFKVKPENVDTAQFTKHLQAANFPGCWVTNVALTTMGPVTALLTANPLRPDKNAENFITPQYQSAVAAVAAAASPDEEKKAIGSLTDFMLEQAFHNTVVQGTTVIVGADGLSGVTSDLTNAINVTDARLAT